MIAMLRLPEGATVDEVASVTAGDVILFAASSGNVEEKARARRRLGQEERGRVTRIAERAN